jgi:cytochrome c oxidase subunit IV
MTDRPQSVPSLLGVYGSLLCLLALAAGSRILPAGWWSTVISLVIASAKTSLIAYFFMNLKGQPWIVRVFAVAGLFWLLILLTLSASDYFTRAVPG